MNKLINSGIGEDNDLKKVSDLFVRNKKLFIIFLVIAFGVAFLINRLSIPEYRISASILIKEKNQQPAGGNVNEFLNSNLFFSNQNFQNELWVIKSTPVIEQTIRNLDLTVTYYYKSGLKYADGYGNMPFKVTFLPDHPQPLNVRFRITFISDNYFKIEADASDVTFYNFSTEKVTHRKKTWILSTDAAFGELIKNDDAAFIVNPSNHGTAIKKFSPYAFDFRTVSTLGAYYRKNLEFRVVDRLATVIEISQLTGNIRKGIDLINEIMSVYSAQNLERKNHIASITINYIEKQLDEISDSLSQTEDNLQHFRASNQLLNVSEQASGISEQYLNLQNQLAELVTRKRYYDYVSEYLSKNDNFSNIIVPASLGIQDPLLGNLMAELIGAQSQLTNLVKNNQEKNPLVQRLNIQIDNIKKTISDNISAVSKTTSISIDEMDKRIRKVESEISRLPLTQRKLGIIERKYRLNDAIYNYMLEKRAEAKITKASNLPDNVIIEPAKLDGIYPVSPDRKLNYIIAVFMGLAFPLGFITLRSALNTRIESQEDIEAITKIPVLGRILHSFGKSNNVMFDFPGSDIAESFRALRTNLDFYVRGGHKKIIMVTSSVEREGKSFVARNLAMGYAQLGRKTILVDFDMRKHESYFGDKSENRGLSSYLIEKSELSEIIKKSPNDKLDYICAGVIPPNPAELIALNRTKELLDQLKKVYDIIILDTTPLAQVTDAYLLVDHSELKIIVVRQNYTLKKVLSLISKDIQLKSINNVCVVLNDNRDHLDRYGYGYGYNRNGKERKSVKKVLSA
ncbi:MAG TPA: polysaccharide biosynthesis tyrosine autokinase [Bacteroidales bacterium]|nr:polysaccharide biosynthesis tyrosine autokinase [Bacteroidales bacterium]